MAFIAGPYTGTYNSLTLGQSRDGYNLQFSPRYEEVIGDNFAEAVQELIYRGVNAYWDTILQEYNAAAAASAFWPWAAMGVVGQVGRIMGSAIGAAAAVAKQMQLQVVAGTTAAAFGAAGPATLTIAAAILAPNMNVSMVFAPRLRSVPIRMQALPNSGGVLFALS